MHLLEFGLARTLTYGNPERMKREALTKLS